MEENFQKIDDLIQVFQIVISKDRCLCSDSQKERLTFCIILLKESKIKNKSIPMINWELVFKAMEIAALLFIDHTELFKHLL